jgi:DcuC family C4-dicarboxylate transporter
MSMVADSPFSCETKIARLSDGLGKVNHSEGSFWEKDIPSFVAPGFCTLLALKVERKNLHYGLQFCCSLAHPTIGNQPMSLPAFSYWLDLPPGVILTLGVAIICVGVYAIYQQLEVRLVLLLTALALGCLAGRVETVVQKFLETFANERFVVPICTAMGFAYVLRYTQCDQHLVHLLVRPLTKVRFLLIPGTVVVGFLVNMPIISQTSTAVTIGPVIIPILRAAHFSPATIGAAILLGSSIGGELLNPGAPELRTVTEESQNAARREAARGRLMDPEKYNSELCQQRILPLNFLGLLVATSIFWFFSWREEKSVAVERSTEEIEAERNFRINPLMALVPLVPLVLLYLTSPLFQIQKVPDWWLEENISTAPKGRFESRLIGCAMLVGTALAGLVVWRQSLGVAKAFFEGAGYGFTHIISLIVVANCFGKGIEEIGLAQAVGEMIKEMPGLLLPTAAVVSVGFAALSGSGMAATQSLFGFFVQPSLDLGIDPTHTGAVVSLGAAAGRTMSPVAAVTLMTATMTGVSPLVLARRVVLPLLAGVLGFLILAMALAPGV